MQEMRRPEHAAEGSHGEAQRQQHLDQMRRMREQQLRSEQQHQRLLEQMDERHALAMGEDGQHDFWSAQRALQLQQLDGARSGAAR